MLPPVIILLGMFAAGCNDCPLLPKRTADLPGDPGHLPPGAGQSTTASPDVRQITTCAPASAEVTARVDKIGRQLVDANQQYALRPIFMTAHRPDPEISHQGTTLVMVTDTLASMCTTDGQLAAVMGLELGKMIAERQAQQAAARRQRDRPQSMNVAIGGGLPGGGSPDHTELAEMVKMHGDNPTSQPVDPANPESIARAVLVRAGYADTEVDGVRDMLKAAEANTALHRRNEPQTGR
jgi:hypothetical protein